MGSKRSETLRDYLRSMCGAWCPDRHDGVAERQRTEEASLLNWFRWPPDMFLLTSSLLEDTGLYRFPVVLTSGRRWPPSGWHDNAGRYAEEWREWVAGGDAEPPEWIKGHVATIARRLDTPFTDLIEWQNPQHGDALRDLCQAIVEIHAVADFACVGLGLPSGHMHTDSPGSSQVAFLANLLLIITGSLSRLPRQRGVVLPKMRTPQVGLTLRSLTLHVTFHRTEVEVKWRSLPWVNQSENTINLVVVPFPYEIESRSFRPVPHPGFSEVLGSVRYFFYDRDGDGKKVRQRFRPEHVVQYVRNAERHVQRVNLVVLPEAALTDQELRQLQHALEKECAPVVPILIAGLANEPSSPESLPTNEVVLSTFFAGKWYDVRQSKHHRWRLDSTQIEQYQIAGALTGSQIWWEAIDLPRRQVCCMAPNSWLALCPLICEDLARQEPVSEIIRGVGPTLLIAILLDGPQIKERWSARYASVLADDPGSSVLTVTAYGMATRSQTQDRKEHRFDGAPRSIALWKDQRTGFREVALGPEHGAAVLTMSAEWSREYSCDGRHDDGFAASFALHGYRVLERRHDESGDDEMAEAQVGDAVDIEELSILTHLVDSIVDHGGESVRRMCRWALGKKEETSTPERPWAAAAVIDDILACVDEARRRRPNRDEAQLVVRLDMLYAVNCFQAAIESVNASIPADGEGSTEPHERWTALIEVAKRLLSGDSLGAHRPPDLNQREVERVHEMTGRGILWAVHMRLDFRRRFGEISNEQSKCLARIERELFCTRTGGSKPVDSPITPKPRARSRRPSPPQREEGSEG